MKICFKQISPSDPFLELGIINPQSKEQLMMNIRQMIPRQTRIQPIMKTDDSSQTSDKTFINKIRKVCSILKLKDSTFYLSLALFEVFNSGNKIAKQNMMVVALVCLEIAAKLRENREQSLTLECVQLMCKAYSLKFLRKVEKQILIFLNFKINLATIFDFLECFLIVKETYEPLPQSYIKFDERITKMKEIAKDVLHLVVQSCNLSQFTALEIAVSIIQISRHILGCSKISPKNLKLISGSESLNLKRCIKFLLDYLKNVHQEEVIDGYMLKDHLKRSYNRESEYRTIVRGKREIVSKSVR